MKQLSVLIENTEGRLEEVLTLLGSKNINIISLSLADTTDYGMLRLIVSDPELGKDALKAEGFSAHLSDVVGVKLPHTVGSLNNALHTVSGAGINIEYMYALCTKTDEAAIVIKPNDIAKANEVLTAAGFSLFTDGDLF